MELLNQIEEYWTKRLDKKSGGIFPGKPGRAGYTAEADLAGKSERTSS